MFARRLATPALGRSLHTSASSLFKVAVLGASGGIGQPLSLLLKQMDGVTELRLYDVANTPGVAADLSHICTPAKVTGHIGAEQLADALKGAEVVVIPAGVPRKPGMTRDDLFNTNASIVKTLAEGCAAHCPNAHMLIISNPVNSTVPIAAEIFKKKGLGVGRIFGVTTLDVTRARTFVSEVKKLDPRTLDIPVVGGHAGATILPLLSQNSAKATFTKEETEALTHRIQFGGDEVVKAKNGAGSATLSMAYAAAHFTGRLLEALKGKKGVVECAFVSSTATSLPFFATPVELGPNGAEKIHPVPAMNDFEKGKFEEMLKELDGSIKKGVEFANK